MKNTSGVEGVKGNSKVRKIILNDGQPREKTVNPQVKRKVKLVTSPRAVGVGRWGEPDCRGTSSGPPGVRMGGFVVEV